MAGMPVLAVGGDRAWRARLERMLALRGELAWRGAYESDALRAGRLPLEALWLVDGDDPVVERACERYGRHEPARLVFLRRPDAVQLRRCAQLGASGCLDKQAPPEVVLRAIRAVGTGLFAVDPSLLLDALAQQLPPLPGAAPAEPPPPLERRERWPQLTQRQREIVRWAAQGLSNKQIARQLGISPETVKTHLHHVFEREGISGRMALVASLRAEAALPNESDDVAA